jgi:hypothetical protein
MLAFVPGYSGGTAPGSDPYCPHGIPYYAFRHPKYFRYTTGQFFGQSFFRMVSPFFSRLLPGLELKIRLPDGFYRKFTLPSYAGNNRGLS